MTTVQITTYHAFRTYAFGGNSIITIVSNKTQTHFTYRFTTRKGVKEAGNFNVEVLLDNKYRILGKVIWYGKKFIYIPGYVKREWRHYKAFLWVWRHIINNSFPKGIYVWREDKCCVCRKRLTNPESIVRGIGPECIKTYNGRLPGKNTSKLFHTITEDKP